jgi:small subunit ribosomal protein S11
MTQAGLWQGSRSGSAKALQGRSGRQDCRRSGDRVGPGAQRAQWGWRAGAAPAAQVHRPLPEPSWPARPTAAELLGEIRTPRDHQGQGSKNIASGIASILATFNTPQVSITDMHGSLLGWSAPDRSGSRARAKHRLHTAQRCSDAPPGHVPWHESQCASRSGLGRESAIRSEAIGLGFIIRDVTPVPQNGCRPRKKRRVWLPVAFAATTLLALISVTLYGSPHCSSRSHQPSSGADLRSDQIPGRRNYGPGCGPKSSQNHRLWAGLLEKQKLRYYYYGLLERQFRGV